MAEVEALIEGYKEFYKQYFHEDDSLYKQLAEDGQTPKTLIIACSDSRVDPSIITHAKPGDIFVVRNVANLVPPYQTSEKSLHGVSSALEFAVRILDVNHIVILGHSNCAGIGALLDPSEIKDMDFIQNWVEVGALAKNKVIENHPNASQKKIQHECSKEAILLSLDNLLTFPWIRSKVELGNLKLHGWHFSITDGNLKEYNATTSNFESVL